MGKWQFSSLANSEWGGEKNLEMAFGFRNLPLVALTGLTVWVVLNEYNGLVDTLSALPLGSVLDDALQGVREEAESIASHRPSRKKFVLGFVTGLAVVLLLRDRFFNNVVNRELWYFFT